MKHFGLAAVAAIVLAGAASASAATMYPSLDLNFSAASNTAVNTTSANTALADVFLDPDGGAQAGANRYYGGIIKYSPNTNNWGGGITLHFPRQDGSEGIKVQKPAGSDFWRFSAPSSGVNTTVAANGTDFPFVIKVVDLDWNVARADIFVGASALAATEGTPDYQINVIGFVSVAAGGHGGITDANVQFLSENWASGASSGSTRGIFSATTWTPVAVPEPGTLALLAASGLLALRRREAK